MSSPSATKKKTRFGNLTHWSGGHHEGRYGGHNVPVSIDTDDHHSVTSEVTSHAETPHGQTKKKKKKKSKIKKLLYPKSSKSSNASRASNASDVYSVAESTSSYTSRGSRRPRQRPPADSLQRSEGVHGQIDDSYSPAKVTARKPEAAAKPDKVATKREAKTLYQRGQVYERIGDYNKAAGYYKQSYLMHKTFGDAESEEEAEKARSAIDNIRDKVTIDLDKVPAAKARTKPAQAAYGYHDAKDSKPVRPASPERKKGVFGGVIGYITEPLSQVVETAASSVATTVTTVSTSASNVVTGSKSKEEPPHEKSHSKEPLPEGNKPAPLPPAAPRPAPVKFSKSSSDPVITANKQPFAFDGVGLKGPQSDKKYEKSSIEYYEEGMVKFHKKDFEAARECFQSAIKRSKKPKHGEPISELAMLQYIQGDTNFKLGKYAEAEDNYKAATELYQREQDEYQETLAMVMMKRGDTLVHMGQKSRAHLYYNVSGRLWKALYDKENNNILKLDDSRLCYFLYNCGSVSAKQDNFKAAQESFLEVISLSVVDTLNNFEIIEITARANNDLGNIHYKAGQYKEAIRYYEAALELRKKNYEVNKDEDIDDKEEMVGLYTNLGRAYLHRRIPDKAMKCFQKANRILMAESARNDLSISENWIQMGKVRSKQGEYDDARELYNDAIKMQVKSLESDSDPKILLIRHDIALTYARERNYEQALEIMAEILQKKKASGEQDLYLAKIYLDMCSIDLKTKNVMQARSHLKFASQTMDEQKIPKEHSYRRTQAKYEAKLKTYKLTMSAASKYTRKGSA